MQFRMHHFVCGSWEAVKIFHSNPPNSLEFQNMYYMENSQRESSSVSLRVAERVFEILRSHSLAASWEVLFEVKVWGGKRKPSWKTVGL